MEAELTQAFPTADISLIGGGGGVFDVHVAGELLYSKKKIHCGNFPKDGEVTTLIKQHKNDATS